MKFISVVGSGSGCGKTTVACGILRAIPGLAAVKISPRACPGRIEWGPGEADKDTDRYLRSGAAKVARIVGPRNGVHQAWERIKGEFEESPGLVVEGTQGTRLPGDTFRIFVAGQGWQEKRQARNKRLVDDSAVVIDMSSHFGVNIERCEVWVNHTDLFFNKSADGAVIGKTIPFSGLLSVIRAFLVLP